MISVWSKWPENGNILLSLPVLFHVWLWSPKWIDFFLGFPIKYNFFCRSNKKSIGWWACNTTWTPWSWLVHTRTARLHRHGAGLHARTTRLRGRPARLRGRRCRLHWTPRQICCNHCPHTQRLLRSLSIWNFWELLRFPRQNLRRGMAP